MLAPPGRRHGEEPPFTRLKHEARRLCFITDPGHIVDDEARAVILAYTKAGTIDLYATASIDRARLLELPGVPPGPPPRHPMDDSGGGAWIEPDGLSNGWFAVWGLVAAITRGLAKAEKLGLPEAASRHAIILAETAAQFSGCDGLISDDPIVLALAGERSYAYSSRDAVALIGLQARLNGDFSLGPDQGPFGQFFFYWVLMRELLPSAWTWFSACLDCSRAEDGDPEIGDIAGAALVRLDRALRSRDRFHGEAKRIRQGNLDEEDLFYFETTLLYLAAAFDAAARVAARVYSLGSRITPSWRNRDWLMKLAHRDRTLADLAAPEAFPRDALDAVQILRNTIHGEALRGIDHRSGGSRRHLLLIPARELDKLRPVIERRGGPHRWGLINLGQSIYLEPQLYIEAVIADASSALDQLIAATDVSRLRGVNIDDLRGRPSNVPSGRSVFDRDRFAFENRRRLRALAGFAPIEV